MSSRAQEKQSARERLLAAANELFYAEGVNNVGIERVLEKAGVAKASLYATFGSKEELVRAYLELRQSARVKRITERIAQHRTPRAKILAIYDLAGELVTSPTFRGCAFVNASSESPGERVRSVCTDSRAWLRDLFASLAHDAGVFEHDRLGDQLMLLYDGALVTGQMERDPSAAATARALAASLIDAAAGEN